MWSELRADCQFYSKLRYPGGAGRLQRAFICMRSLGLFVLAMQRIDHYYNIRKKAKGWTPETALLKLASLTGRALAMTIAKCDVAWASAIAGGVYLSDRGHLIIGPQRVGSGTLIHDRVTIGVRAGGGPVKPVVEENVWIGPDCVIYGDITIGAGATVLPGTVLSMNVPPRALVGGNPAIIIKKDFDNTKLRQSLACEVDREQLVEATCDIS